MSDDAPPVKCLATRYLHTFKTGRLRQDTVRFPGGRERDIVFTENRGAAYVVPITPAGEVVLIRQFRYCVGEWLWEVPAGGLFDEGDPATVAKAELAEEIGGVADELLPLGWFFDSAPLTSSKCHLFVARNTRLTLPMQHSAGELIERRVVAAAEALAWARSGRILDARSALSLLLSERFLMGAHS